MRGVVAARAVEFRREGGCRRVRFYTTPASAMNSPQNQRPALATRNRGRQPRVRGRARSALASRVSSRRILLSSGPSTRRAVKIGRLGGRDACSSRSYSARTPCYCAAGTCRGSHARSIRPRTPRACGQATRNRAYRRRASASGNRGFPLPRECVQGAVLLWYCPRVNGGHDFRPNFSCDVVHGAPSTVLPPLRGPSSQIVWSSRSVL